ncbi:MAG: DUF4382 domain-containing protein [Hydrogenophaga sp.]|nr:DUF4382 domain-containing protein [Burkholderiaceae bacterium]MDZ4127649.1 DUF4382 domain-containing protein [Hydrogenophaga sp.]MDZ4357287.1 DUF4382 domain-containing protein [Variovorax sp.]
MIKRKLQQTGRLFCVAATLALAACGGGGGIGGTGAPIGSLRFAVTDAPACGYDQVNVTLQKVRVHQSATAADGDTGWSEVVLTPEKRVDLLTLTNGVLEELGQTSLPAGKYTQLRLVLADNTSAAPLANSVVPTGGAETALDTPSAAQSGLKLNVDIDVPAGQLADFVIDFDACKSVVPRGNSGRFNLKPVIRVIPRLTDAGLRVVGYVAPAIANTGTQVSLQLNGTPVKATLPDASGTFVLYPVPVGSYDLVVTAAGRATSVMTSVPVTTATVTTVNGTATAITPAVSASRTVTGTVTPTTATVRATQALAGGPPAIEVAWAPVDADTGRFAFTLALAAPGKTAYVANPATLTFTPAAAAGLYRLEAASGAATKFQAIDVTAPVPPVTFTFP